jgi:hypothetical protein
MARTFQQGQQSRYHLIAGALIICAFVEQMSTVVLECLVLDLRNEAEK